ncbi:hypothetical protein [Microbacterium sp.]|jgi:hypothetical protein|uniref:hypothetical protein n=1 Tax=Microbacterium sp. TaxID=51671 RepID=UPI0025D68687|nr:hypothetical protein [Microbacterium sp.]MBT9607137.1 hypothetical protein [Microbacterium sp.]
MVTALDKYADAEPHWDGPVVIAQRDRTPERATTAGAGVIPRVPRSGGSRATEPGASRRSRLTN